MRLMYGIVLLLVSAVAACGDDNGGGSSPADAIPSSDSPGASDASPGSAPLEVDWDAQPQLGTLNTTLSVSKAQFHVDRLQVISDVDDPTQTTARNLALVWTDTGALPQPVRFEDAPPALYSKIKVTFDTDQTSTTFSVQITGTTDLGTGPQDFRIESQRLTSIEISGYSTSLIPGGSATMGVALDVKHAIANVDWSTVPHPNNTYVLDDLQTTAMDAFFVDLDSSFSRYPP